MAKLNIKTRFATTPNNLLDNPEITLKAKGLYAYIQSKPDGWDFSAERIAFSLKEGISGIKAGLTELEKHGYLHRRKFQDNLGYWQIEYTLYEFPYNEIPSVENPTKEIPTKENPIVGKSSNIIKKDLSKKEVIIKSNVAPEQKEQNFKETLRPFIDKYPTEMLKAFFLYWTEPNKSGKMRFELQPTWEVSRRLANWASKDYNKTKIEPQKPKSTAQDILSERNIV